MINKTGKPKQTERIDENVLFLTSYFDAVLHMKQKQINKAKKQRDKNKEAK